MRAAAQSDALVSSLAKANNNKGRRRLEFQSVGPEWFYNPFFQAGLAPLVVALIAASAASRLLPALSGLALMAGFLASVSLVGGISLIPRTVADKIILIGVCAAILGFIVDAQRVRITNYVPFLFPLFIAAIIWLLWPVLVRKDLFDSLIMVGGLGVFGTAITWMLSRFSDRPGHAYLSTLSLSFGLGASAFFASDALIGQLATGLGAAAVGAAIPIGIAWIPAFRTQAGMAIPSVEQGIESGQAVALATGVLIALFTAIAKVHADLPWASVIALLGVPLIAQFSPDNRKQFGFTVLIGGLIPILFAIASAYFTFQIFAPVAVPLG